MNEEQSMSLTAVLKYYNVELEGNRDLQYYDRISKVSTVISFDEIPDLSEQTNILHELQGSGFSVFETDRIELRTLSNTEKYGKCILAFIDKEEGFWMIWR